MQHFNREPIQPLEELAIPLISDVMDGPPDLIPGFLPRAGTLVVAGETNCGKSLLALEAVSSMVTGNMLWGELQPHVTFKKVLYVLGEHHNETIQRLWQHTKLPMTESVMLLGPEKLSYDRWLVTSAKPNILAIDKFKRWSEGFDMIVWDPLSAFACGADGENDNLGMRLLLDTMSMIAQSTGAACLVLAHQGKPTIDSYGKEHTRKSYATRGASGIEDSATHIFYMGKGEADPSQKISGGNVFELNQRKYKGEAPSQYRLLRDPNTLTHTLLGNKPYVEVLKIDAQAKISRLQASNPNIDYRTAVRLVGAMEGVSEETIKRRIGLTS